MKARTKYLVGMLAAGALLIGAGWLSVALATVFWDSDRYAGRSIPTLREADGQFPVLWDVPTFSALDQDGRAVSDRSLQGTTWVADFIFTRCTTACPLLTATMRLLQRELVQSDVRFVSFTVDPDFDRPAVLKEYAARWQADSRWSLLNTGAAGAGEVARGMKVSIERDGDENNPIVHSSFFFLVDAAGRVRSIYDSLDRGSVDRLRADATDLVMSRRRQPTDKVASMESSVGGLSGEVLFRSFGCNGCHDNAKVAPSLAGVLGRVIRLSSGDELMADSTYLRESILSPSKHIVAGYEPIMPTYREHLSESQLDALVSYVASAMPNRAGEPQRSPAEPPADSTEDPVCKMTVTPREGSPRQVYRGKTYHFCSEPCRDRFARDPGKYAQ